jgi:hypothetical protein
MLSADCSLPARALPSSAFGTFSPQSVQLGDAEAAMDQLELAYQKHERDVIYFKTSPTYAALRTNPRFQELLKKIGFPE